MNDSRLATYGVLAFGLLMALIGLGITTYTPPAPVPQGFTLTSIDQLLGRWNTRTVAEDRLNGAYSGYVLFGPDHYEIQNDVVARPIRIDHVQYDLDDNHARVWVEGNQALSTEVTLLRADRASIQMPGHPNLVLYMYKAP